jgi:hypothetical protein
MLPEWSCTCTRSSLKLLLKERDSMKRLHGCSLKMSHAFVSSVFLAGIEGVYEVVVSLATTSIVFQRNSVCSDKQTSGFH